MPERRRRRKMTDQELAAFLEAQIADSTWWDDSEVQGNYRDALDSYYGRGTVETTDGRSTAQSSDTADMVEAVTAQVMSSFDFAEIAHFPPVSADDVSQARLESAVTNDYIMGKNDGYTVFQEAIRNALLLRNGVIKVWAEERIVTRTIRYQEELKELALGLELTPASDSETRELVSQPGNPTQIRVTTTLRRLSLRSVDVLNFIVWREYDEHDLAGCPLSGERYFLTQSELLERGHPWRKVKDIPSTSTDTHISSTARNRGQAQPARDGHGDPAGRLIECFELYVLVDYDGDGVAELRRVLYAGGVSGGTVLENDPWSRVPYASGSALIAPQRWQGISLFDKLRDVEEIKGDALRQWLDNLAFANTAELVVVDGAVEMDDLTARRPGGINRVDDMNAWAPLDMRSNGPESKLLLDYMDSVRSERGGASLDLQNAQLQIAGETAHGTERQFESREMLAQLMTRSLAETLVRQTFELCHDTLRREFPERATGGAATGFVVAQPGRWRYRDEIEVTAGIGQAQRLQRRAATEAILVQQEKLHQSGFGDGVLVDLDRYHNALSDWSAASGVPDPRRYWVDPNTPQSQQAQQAKAVAAQRAQEEQQAQLQTMIRSQVEIEGRKVMGDLVVKHDELLFKYWSEGLKAAVKEAEIESNANADEVDQYQAQGRVRSVG